MERVSVIVSKGTRERLERIKYLRRQENGVILADQEIIVAANYFVLARERKESKSGEMVEYFVVKTFIDGEQMSQHCLNATA
jgi:hypothetical protein